MIPGIAGLLLALIPAVAAAPASAAAAPPAAPAFTPLATTPLPNGFGAIEVDGATQRIFVSSPTSSIVTALNFDGQSQGTVAVPGAGALLVDGGTLYVASTTAGRIDAFNAATLAPVGSFGGGTLFMPRALVKAGGQLWLATGECGSFFQWVSIQPATGVVTTHEAPTYVRRCPLLTDNPADPNVIFGVDLGDNVVERVDVSSGAPVSAGHVSTNLSNASDLEVFPDGTAFALSAAYVTQAYGTVPFGAAGVQYPTGAHPKAVESTAGAGGLVAVGRHGSYEPDVYVFRLGDPSQVFLTYDFGASNNTLKGRGLAFGPDGSRLFAVSGDQTAGTAILTVFGPPGQGGSYHPLAPARILDTRSPGAGRLSSGATVDVAVTGKGGVPVAGVAAVALNVTVTQPTATSFLTLYPVGTTRPLASNLNFTAGKTVPNLVVVKVGAGGNVSMYNETGSVDVVLDVAGWFSDPTTDSGPAGRLTSLVPSRILDTRDDGLRLGPGASLDLQVAGRGGVPDAGAMAAVLNMVATGTTDTSFVTVYPTGEGRPLASNLNFNAGDTVSNRTMVKLGTGGKVTVYNLAGSADIVVDVAGWFNDVALAPAGGTYAAIPPARILDTRDFWTFGFEPVAGGTAIAVQVAGRAGVPPTGVSAVILNATVVNPVGPGFLTIFPTGGNRPLASDVTFATGETRPNLTVVQLGEGGKIDLYASTTTDVVFDVAGWVA